MIKVQNLSYAIPDSAQILTNVSFEISKGDYIGLLGENGAGKTTLIDLIMGLRVPTEGTISVLGADPIHSDREVFASVGYLSQDVWLKDNITVLEFFKFHQHFYETYSKDDQEMLTSYFSIDLKAKIGSLSTGQKRRVQITGALAIRPKVLIIDEITAVLDPDARKLLFDLLMKMNIERGTSILLATNIVEDLKGRVNRVLFIKDHQMKEHSPESMELLFSGDN